MDVWLIKLTKKIDFYDNHCTVIKIKIFILASYAAFASYVYASYAAYDMHNWNGPWKIKVIISK